MADPNGKSSDAAIQGNGIWDNSSGDATNYSAPSTPETLIYDGYLRNIQTLFSLLPNKYWDLSEISRQYNIHKQLNIQ